MPHLMTTAEMDAQTGWSAKQRNHLRRLIRDGATIAYVVTDRHGRPSNGGPATREWQVRPGLVQRVQGPLDLCGPRALHGTYSPHKWRGERVWIAGFVGEVHRQEDKIGALQREIVGEVYPECSLSESVGVRLGRKDNLYGANLCGANLRGANLCGANLYGADLYGADLRGANLRGADLYGADLYGANLRGADLYGADLRGADLYGADLRGANLYGANLYGANLCGANLYGADLYGADLRGANLRGANLRGANLCGANLYGADLYGAYCPNAKEAQQLIDAGYENDESGYLRKKQ